MWFWGAAVSDPRGAKGGGDQRADTPLPIGPSNEGAAHGAFRAPELLKNGARALKSKADAEAPSCGDCDERRLPCVVAAAACDRRSHLFTRTTHPLFEGCDECWVRCGVRHLLSVAVFLQAVPQSSPWQGSIDPVHNRLAAAVYLATALTLGRQSVVLPQVRRPEPLSPTQRASRVVVATVAVVDLLLTPCRAHSRVSLALAP